MLGKYPRSGVVKIDKCSGGSVVDGHVQVVAEW